MVIGFMNAAFGLRAGASAFAAAFGAALVATFAAAAGLVAATAVFAAGFFGAVAISGSFTNIVENAPIHASLIVVGFAGRCKCFLTLFAEKCVVIAIVRRFRQKKAGSSRIWASPA
jgi:hypothetical protein